MTFGPDGNLYLGYRRNSDQTVARFNGRTGALIDKFINPIAEFPGTIVFTQRDHRSARMATSSIRTATDSWTAGKRTASPPSPAGLSTRWNAIFNGDGSIDASRVPNWRHKDLYLEVDWMNLHEPDRNALNGVVTSFANAPVINLDGQTGVRLHLLINEEALPHTPQNYI